MALLVAILAYGMTLRSWDLGALPLWVDEAETSINALTILQEGVPIDRYLGLPIFENVFTREWPESDEYEFKDTSYSDHGLAIYHGWLPLYATAAAFAAAGIQPDEVEAPVKVRHSTQEMVRRTAVARAPAVLFGLVFLVGIFVAACALYGADAGWAAVSAAAVSGTCINLARTARYYSATTALNVLCCLLICLMVKRGRWRDFTVGGALLVLLFHTNTVSFASLCLAAILLVPLTSHQVHIVRKWSLWAGIIALGTVPWMLLTGFLTSHVDRPRAWTLLSFEQILNYPRDRWPWVLLACVLLLWLLAAWTLRGRLPSRLTLPFLGSGWAFLFLWAWTLISFLIFVSLIPAASYFHARITLKVIVPAILFGAMLFAAAARAVAPRYSALLASASFVLVLSLAGMTSFRWRSISTADLPLYRLTDYLRTLNIGTASRLYSDGGSNLVLRFYTGLPFQNIMPVRKSFIDRYPGELLILESPKYDRLAWQRSQRVAGSAASGQSNIEASRLSRQVSAELVRRDLSTRVARVYPPPDKASDHITPLFSELRLATSNVIAVDVKKSGSPIFEGYEITDYTKMWQVFFYRFADPESRVGTHLNYSDRIRDANAYVLRDEWVLLRSPAHRGAPDQ